MTDKPTTPASKPRSNAGLPLLLTVAETAQALRIKPSAVKSLIKNGKLDALQLSPRVHRIKRESLLQMMMA